MTQPTFEITKAATFDAAHYFAERLRVKFPGLSRIVVSRPTIGESCALSL